LTDDFIGEFLHWDGKFPATLRSLLRRPGELTQEFLKGKRRRWLSPFRLYLTISITYFFTGPVLERLTGQTERAIARIEISGDSAAREDLALLQDSAAFVNAPEVQANFGIRLMGGPAQAWKAFKDPFAVRDAVAAAIPKVMFLLMPFFALLTWVTWRSTKLNYPAHLVFSFHVHSAFFAVLWVGKLIEPTGMLSLILAAQVAILVYSTWYVIRACRVGLGGTTKEVVLRSTVVGLLYLPLAMALTLGATTYAIRTL
jgi:hypothetical protein